MGKQKPKNKVNTYAYIGNLDPFGLTSVKKDATLVKPGANGFTPQDIARIELENEIARRKTYLNPQGKSATPAMRQAAEDRIAQEKTNAFTRKIAEGAQTVGGALELAAPFTGPFMPIVGGVGAGLGIGSSTYLAGKDAMAGNYGSAALNAGFGALDLAGFTALRNPAVKDFVQGADHISDYSQVVDLSGVSDITKNLQDLEYAKQFSKQYGYKLPENLQRIAQSDELTSRTIRGMMDRHNTFVRGVSTNWDVIAKKNPEILKHLEKQGIDWKNNPKAAAEYMATHIPIDTGYGRVGLNEATSDKGLSALYTSNSIPTAEGYTYGQGFITKVKKPTDYSSVDRKDWIDKNVVEYYDNNLPNIPEEIQNYSGVSIDGVPKRTWEINHSKYNPKEHGDIEKFKNKVLQDQEEAADRFLKNYDQYKDTNPELYEIGQKNYNYAKGWIEDLRNKKWEPYIQDLSTDVKFDKNILKTDYNSDNGYAHYLHLGNPGEQVLQAIKSWEITPKTWVNQSRSHVNIPTDKLSRAAIAPLGLAAGESLIEPEQKRNGGWLDKYEDGGEVDKPKTSQRTDVFNQDTLTLPEGSFVKFAEAKKKSRLKGTSDNQQIDDAADWLTNWYSSSGAQRRLAESLTTASPKQVLQDVKDNINNVYVLRDSNSNFHNEGILDNKNNDANSLLSKAALLNAKLSALQNKQRFQSGASSYVAGFHQPFGHIINITEGMDSKNVNETAVHELTHAGNLDKYYNAVGKDILKKYPIATSNGAPLFPANIVNGKPSFPSKKHQEDAEYIKHDGAYPRLMEMRYNSKINPNQVITPEQFKKIKAENPKNDLFRYYTDYDIINMLNHFAANDMPAQTDVMQAEDGTELNANNYTVSAPEGYEGSGYFNEGRNYSPAWGGQFKEGGELPNVTVKGKRQPIVVTNPNDPRLKAYSDSLRLYNKGEKAYKERLAFNKKNNIPKSSTRKWNNPVEYHIVNKKGDIKLNKIQPIEGNGYWYNFDPDNVAGTNIPSNLTDNYGFRYKKPTQPVVYQKPEPTPQSTIDWMEGNNYAQDFVPEVTPEQPTTPGLPFGFIEDPRTHFMHKYRTSTGELEYPFEGGQTHVTPKMQMGGSLPGAVGFTYARTNNPAPSNGPYAKKTKASAQNGTEMKFYQGGLDFQPKTISRNGSVIKDDMGQWAHPGEITEIGSNQITMQGVPYPVLGISDTGDTQMMYPNQEYQYDGSSVTEYPMMKQGGQLTKLNQLTNFTNYNTKQPGGWLDKYQ